MDLNRLRVFVAVADAGGFTAAAERLGSTKALVSQQVARLEAELGVMLFSRTTRRVTLTEAGTELFADSAPLIAQAESALARVAQGGEALRGTLRITAPVDFAAGMVAPALARFAAAHPDMQFDLVAADTVLDMVAARIDIAFRMGWLRDSTQRAVMLGEVQQWVVCTPDYLASHGPIDHPSQLAEHRWIALSLLPAPLSWRFSRHGDEQSEDLTVRMRAALRTDSPTTLNALACEGAGVTASADMVVREDVEAGRLVRVLADWQLPAAGIYAVYPPGRHVPAKSKAFIAAFREYLRTRG
ncbi:LysR family transcriptional regulator [Uliginosibacterium sp. H1]|uniref:LysR family transcriptional regulator n=1 Tax=Uliginosibacterium sp. H1 TaxID=3114757 RepID=UPI002E188034|nr:LysR family transcriptional regulator [Uliginosibacterium sp. H1]